MGGLISNQSNIAAQQSESFTEGAPSTGGLNFDLVQIVGSVFVFMFTLPQTLSLFTTAIGVYFGVNPLILSGITAIVIMGMLFTGWRLLRAGA